MGSRYSLSLLSPCLVNGEFVASGNEAGSVLGKHILATNSVYTQLQIALAQMQSNIKYYIPLPPVLTWKL